jgi:hypothetical protein
MPALIAIILCVIMFRIFGRHGVFFLSGAVQGLCVSGIIFCILANMDNSLFSWSGLGLIVGSGVLFGGIRGAMQA